MELLETHEELIESNPNSISFFWKGLQVFLYFVGFVSGYGSGTVFYILWHKVFKGHCPIRAHVLSPSQFPSTIDDLSIVNEMQSSSSDNWRHAINVSFKYAGRCNLYLLISLASCAFGMIWMTLFVMCGKGGYDTRIFVAPWTIVVPAITFQLVFSSIVWFVVNDLESGVTFINDFSKVTATMNIPQLANFTRPCDMVASYLEIFGPAEYSVCQVYPILRILSWIMAWSWILGLVALTLRIIRVRDFTLLTTKIYKISESGMKHHKHLRLSYDSSNSM